MALETLRNITEVNNHKVHRVEWDHPSDNHIEINDKDNAITFKIQNGPIAENGHNGCQVDEIIATAKIIIEGLNAKFPCEQNIKTIGCLEGALHFLSERKKDRAARGVEGKSEA